MARRLCAVAPLATALGGCYSYGTLPGPTYPAGDLVRVELRPEGAAQLASAIGPQVEWLEGRVDAASATAAPDSSGALAPLRLRVSALSRATGGEERWPSEPVSIPAAAVARVGTRRLDVKRTALAVVGVVGGAALVARAMGASEGSGGRVIGGPGGRQ